MEKFFLDAAPRPVTEIAWVAATGLMAGIIGRAYNVSGAGLNSYSILVGKTGRGKEAIASGIAKLVKAISRSVPTINELVGPTEIASPQALIKWLTRAPCIYSIVGEFGLRLKEMSAPNAPAHTVGLKRALLDLYHKSGHGNVMGAMAYAEREKNTAVINSPSLTIIAESTPETLFQNVSDALVADGALSRFMVKEYCGPRVALNEAHSEAFPSAALVNRLAELAAYAIGLMSRNEVRNVTLSVDAKSILANFDKDCDAQINRDTQGVTGTELWNRAHLKALKLAALYAVGCSYIDPIISAVQAQSACDEIHAQTVALVKKFSTGEIGAVEDNETLRRSEVLKAVIHYAATPFNLLPKYGVSEEIHSAKIVLKTYLQRRLGDTAAFRRARGGATKALDITLKNMVDADEIREIPKSQMVREFGTQARAFAISKAEAFIYPDEN